MTDISPQDKWNAVLLDMASSSHLFGDDGRPLPQAQYLAKEQQWSPIRQQALRDGADPSIWIEAKGGARISPLGFALATRNVPLLEDVLSSHTNLEQPIFPQANNDMPAVNFLCHQLAPGFSNSKGPGVILDMLKMMIKFGAKLEGQTHNGPWDALTVLLTTGTPADHLSPIVQFLLSKNADPRPLISHALASKNADFFRHAPVLKSYLEQAAHMLSTRELLEKELGATPLPSLVRPRIL